MIGGFSKQINAHSKTGECTTVVAQGIQEAAEVRNEAEASSATEAMCIKATEWQKVPHPSNGNTVQHDGWLLDRRSIHSNEGRHGESAEVSDEAVASGSAEAMYIQIENWKVGDLQ